MSNRKFLSDISASAAQAVLSQSAGIIVFFLVSRWLDKAALGQLNWMLALFLVVFSLLGFGLEHISVQKIATGTPPSMIFASFVLHVLLGIGCAALLVLCFWLSGMFIPTTTFVLLAMAQAILFLASPFRPAANGLQRFGVFFWMSSTASLLKLLLLCCLSFLGAVTLSTIAVIYLTASLAELLICLFLYRLILKQPLTCVFSFEAYLGLLKEALPLFGSTLLNTLIGRMDWLLLGLLGTTVAVADYSFVNRVFEIAGLPLLIIAPMLFPQFAKRFGAFSGDGHEEKTVREVSALMRMEIVVSVLIALLLTVCWSPLMDALTANKYGASTRPVSLIMCLGMPLVYINNIFWSLLFARKKLYRILYVFVAGAAVNLVANFFLIGAYHASGAAISLVFTLALQCVLYALLSGHASLGKTTGYLLPVGIIGVLAYMLATVLPVFWLWQASAAVAGYFGALVLLDLVRIDDWATARKMISAQ